MRATARFGDCYREACVLRDGTAVELRCLCPGDAPLLRDGFARLSAHSRRMRFHAAREALAETEVSFLCSPDGESHVAIGAAVRDDRGREHGVGVARFLRVDDRSTAEVAITVVDDFQGRGLGHLLLARLAGAAAERGVERFVFDVLATNAPMLQLARLLGTPTLRRGDGELLVTVPLARAESLASH